jgi:hypothetical protein
MLDTSHAIVLPFGSRRTAGDIKRPNLHWFNNLIAVQAKSPRKTALAFIGPNRKM